MVDEKTSGLTRRSFFQGIGAVSIGFLFVRRLDRVLRELEAENFVSEPQTPEQKPSGATITCTPQHGFRPERIFIAGTVIGTHMVPVRRFVPCEACNGEGYSGDDSVCNVCEEMGGAYVDTGELKEESIKAVPWIIDDITIGDRSLLAIDESLPGDLFSADSMGIPMALESVSPNTSIRFTVRYAGHDPDGEVFHGAIIGTCVDDAGRLSRAALPISSGEVRIAA